MSRTQRRSLHNLDAALVSSTALEFCLRCSHIFHRVVANWEYDNLHLLPGSVEAEGASTHNEVRGTLQQAEWQARSPRFQSFGQRMHEFGVRQAGEDVVHDALGEDVDLSSTAEALARAAADTIDQQLDTIIGDRDDGLPAIRIPLPRDRRENVFDTPAAHPVEVELTHRINRVDTANRAADVMSIVQERMRRQVRAMLRRQYPGTNVSEWRIQFEVYDDPVSEHEVVRVTARRR